MQFTSLGAHERVLLVAQLSVQSSYSEDYEIPAEGNRFDTLQWWVGPARVWRIRTFAIDADIHTHIVPGIDDRVLDVARASTQKHYADVLVREALFRFADYRDEPAVMAEIHSELGMGSLEVADELDLAFWNPNSARYQTRSQPR